MACMPQCMPGRLQMELQVGSPHLLTSSFDFQQARTKPSWSSFRVNGPYREKLRECGWSERRAFEFPKKATSGSSHAAGPVGAGSSSFAVASWRRPDCLAVLRVNLWLNLPETFAHWRAIRLLCELAVTQTWICCSELLRLLQILCESWLSLHPNTQRFDTARPELADNNPATKGQAGLSSRTAGT